MKWRPTGRKEAEISQNHLGDYFLEYVVTPSSSLSDNFPYFEARTKCMNVYNKLAHGGGWFHLQRKHFMLLLHLTSIICGHS